MAYVQSFYLDSNEECVQQQQLAGPSEDSILMNLIIGSNQPLTHSVIGRIVARGNTAENVEKEEDEEKTVVESSYLGFEEDALPPIYREQIRNAKKQEKKAEAAPIVEQKTFEYYESIMNDHKYFAPPQKAEQHALLTNNLYTQDYNTLDVVSVAPQPKSNYLIMSNEDFDEVNGQKKKAESDFQSASGYSVAETSTYTARAADKPSRNNKYHGLSAFRPVGQTTQSQYAYEQ